jgi:hypothetical protein
VDDIDRKLTRFRNRLVELVPYWPLEVYRARYVQRVDEDGETYLTIEPDELGIGDLAAVLTTQDTDRGKIALIIPFTLELLRDTPSRRVAARIASRVTEEIETFLENNNATVDRTTEEETS